MGDNDLMQQMNDIIKGYSKELRVDIEAGLDLAANELKSSLSQTSPDGDTHNFKNSWDIKKQYKGVRYIGNTKVVQSKGSDSVPLSNILEYGENSPHRGFMRRTFESVKDRLYSLFVNRLGGK